MQAVNPEISEMNNHSRPTFDEDEFDLIEHKKAVSTEIKAKAYRKRAHRKIAVGRIVVFVVALIVCVALYFMALHLTALF